MPAANNVDPAALACEEERLASVVRGVGGILQHHMAKLPTPIDLAEVGGLNPLVVAPS